MSDKLKTIILNTFENSMEAEIAKARLEEAGIQSILSGENSNMVIPAFNNTSGVKIYVEEKDVQKAKEILAEETTMQDEDSEFWKIKCPHCGSDNVNKVMPIKLKFSWLRLLKTLLLIPDKSKQTWDLYFCENCKKEFRLSDLMEGAVDFE